MAVKVKSLVAAHMAKVNPQLGGAIDILGSFSEVIRPVFPLPMKNLSLVLTVEGLEKNTAFEMRLNGPDDELISQGEFGIAMSPFGIGKKIIDLENFLISERGKYTIDILEKGPQGFKFIQTCDVFVAAYPPKRIFGKGEIDKILNDDKLIKTMKTEFSPIGVKEPVNLQINLDLQAPVEEGFLAFPADDKITIEGKEYDLTGLRRHIEWMFGRAIPEKKQENDNVSENNKGN